MRVAIPIPTAADQPYNQRCWPSYAEAIRAQNADPVEIPLDLNDSDLETLAASCQAVLLPGSPADVRPGRYGQEAEEHTSPADPARERTDLFLIQHAYATGKPLLGVCFGCQILNVYKGGTLLQDLAVFPVNHPSARGVAVAHNVFIARDSLLASLCDPSETSERDGFLSLPVNSSHHQAVGIAGTALQVSARCPQDKVVEALEDRTSAGHFVLAVQWHPERTTGTSPTSRALFARLVVEAEIWSSLHQETV